MKRGWRVPDTPFATNLAIVAIFLGTVAAVYVVTHVLAGTLLLSVVETGALLSFPAAGLYRWLRNGHGWLATLSWSAPLGTLLVALEFIPGLPPLVRVLSGAVALTSAVAMAAIPEPGEWWYRRVLHRNPPAVK